MVKNRHSVLALINETGLKSIAITVPANWKQKNRADAQSCRREGFREMDNGVSGLKLWWRSRTQVLLTPTSKSMRSSSLPQGKSLTLCALTLSLSLSIPFPLCDRQARSGGILQSTLANLKVRKLEDAEKVEERKAWGVRIWEAWCLQEEIKAERTEDMDIGYRFYSNFWLEWL